MDRLSTALRHRGSAVFGPEYHHVRHGCAGGQHALLLPAKGKTRGRKNFFTCHNAKKQNVNAAVYHRLVIVEQIFIDHKREKFDETVLSVVM